MRGVFAVGFGVIACIQIIFAIAEVSGNVMKVNEIVRVILMRVFRRLRKFFYLLDVAYLLAVLFVFFFTDVRTLILENISQNTIEATRVAVKGIFGTNSFMVLLYMAIIGVTEALSIIVVTAVACCIVVSIAFTYEFETESAQVENDERTNKIEKSFAIEKPFSVNLRLNI